MRKSALPLLWTANALVFSGVVVLGVQIATNAEGSGAGSPVTPPVSLPALAPREEAWGTSQLQNLPNPLKGLKEKSTGAGRMADAASLVGYDQIAEDQKTGTAYLLLFSRQVRVNAYIGEPIVDLATGEEIPEVAGWRLARLVPGAAVFRRGESEETLKIAVAPVASADGIAADQNLVAGPPLRQWASTAKASSEYSPDGWNAQQACGPPNTETAGDHNTAWTTQAEDAGPQWIELTYGIPVFPDGVRIHETFNCGTVVRVEALNSSGQWMPLWAGADPTLGQPIAWFEVPFTPQPFTTRTIRVTLDTAKVPGWNEIDAVELLGRTPEDPGVAKRSPGQPDASKVPPQNPDNTRRNPPRNPPNRRRP